MRALVLGAGIVLKSPREASRKNPAESEYQFHVSARNPGIAPSGLCCRERL
jgi:hypothetical protein